MSRSKLFFTVYRTWILLGCWLLLPSSSSATHLLGGDITWTCNGTGQYVFSLHIFRDCYGTGLVTTGQAIRVWNHASVSQIPVTLISVSPVSPPCRSVPGGPPALDCADGALNSVEMFTFRSDPVSLPGIPPAEGWAFTWDAYSRASCDNLLQPIPTGLTLRSFMYAFRNQQGSPCYDSSPRFSTVPFYTACTGLPFTYNQSAQDPDVDSLVFSFAPPIDHISSGVFNPPAFPAGIPFESGFSATSPTPGTATDPNNVPSSLDPQNGDLNFTSFTTGRYNVVICVASWREGQKISEVYRELPLIVLPCGTNNPPQITPPFGGTSFQTSLYAGETLSFTLAAGDPEWLQDGSPQTLTLQASGIAFGTNFNDAAAGCPNPPCATLTSPMPTSGTQGVTNTLHWQTDCAHLPAGASQATYDFHFQVWDDYCQIPGMSPATVSVTLLSPPPLSATDPQCAAVAPNGDVTLYWTPPADPYNCFIQYEIYNGSTLIGTVPTHSQNNYTHTGANAQNGSRSYHIALRSGCGSGTVALSDTISSMHLTVNNPGNGTAVLQWNRLFTPLNSATSSGWYRIYREYPAGTWTLIDSTAYGRESYIDTITVCHDSLNYRIEARDLSGCISVSSVQGKTFDDILPPPPPEIIAVTVDENTGRALINWEINPSPDTEGYIVLQNQGGFWVVIDTVWGRNNTLYDYLLSNASTRSEIFGVAAFDSCWSGVPSSPNTSAMGIFQQSIYVSTSFDVCARAVHLQWNAYLNWRAGVNRYEIYASENGGPFTLLGQTQQLSYTHAPANRLSNYVYMVRAFSNQAGITSLSNKTTRFVRQPQQPSFHYLQTATVTNSAVEIRCFADAALGSRYRFERADHPAGPYQTIGTSAAMPNPVTFTDYSAQTDSYSYYYRSVVVDSCGDDSYTSNYGRTILLSVTPNDLSLVNTISWNPYAGWDGQIAEYRLYRSLNGIFDANPIAIIPGNLRHYDDPVGNLLETTGEICYLLEAVETTNSYGISEISHSNIGCAVMEPKLWVPNAFTVGGLNPVFKPVTGYVDFDTYQLRIYNRLGQLVFFSSELHTGWDGRHEGRIAPEGVYIWEISFRDGEGKFYERNGFVTLLNAQP